MKLTKRLRGKVVSYQQQQLVKLLESLSDENVTNIEEVDVFCYKDPLLKSGDNYFTGFTAKKQSSNPSLNSGRK